jgi:hypothetical protein
LLSTMVDSWTYTKVFPELPKPLSRASANAAVVNAGSYKVEMTKTVSRAYIAPAQFNR